YAFIGYLLPKLPRRFYQGANRPVGLRAFGRPALLASDVAAAATGLVRFFLAEHDLLGSVFLAEGKACRRPAAYANGIYLHHVFGNGHESGQRAERPPLVVHIQTGYNYARASIGQLVANLGESVVEELCLVDGDYLGIRTV